MYSSPTSEKSGNEERKRTSRACDSCYRRKIKCDTAVPCNWCSHHKIPCTFDRTIRRKRKTKHEANGNEHPKNPGLSERINRIERIVMQNLTKKPDEIPGARESPRIATVNPVEDIPSAIEHPTSSSGMLHFAGRELGGINWITGIPLLLPQARHWVESATGQQVDIERLNPIHPPWEKRRASSNAFMMDHLTLSTFDLPSRDTVENHFNFFNSVFVRFIFPVIDPILFAETITTAYQQPRSALQHGGASIRACIFAFLAFVSAIYHDGCDSVPGQEHMSPVDPESFSIKAHHLLPQILQEPTSLDGMQAVMLLVLLELFTGNMQSANYLTSIVTRLVFVLGAHIATPTSVPDCRLSRVHEHSRNLFWLCYIFDKDLALRTGQPQMLPNETCDLTLPHEYVERLYSSLGSPGQAQELVRSPIFPIDIRLSIFKSRACSTLYSLRASRKTDAELLRDIRELDDELESWRMSVPPQWRPTVSYSQESPPDPNINMHLVVQRLNYHLCMSIIHQASSRCKAWTKGQSGIMEGVSSSLALSVEASRSTLTYLQNAEHVIVGGAFWAIVFYPMSALICIFCAILQNPLDPQSVRDLDLLSSVSGMMVRIFVRQVSSANEIVHIKLITDFVAELHRLAKCAIEKAWNEKGNSTSV